MIKALTVSQAVEFLNNNISEEYLYQLVREKRIPHVKLGRKILFDEAKLEEWWQEEIEKSTRGIRKIAE
ncbi:hypothetical protein BVF91_09675 [Thermoanaerobacterium sp. PSU-2]|uniref:helix-turn-helix domain-containing protein n=1 Tax=Thermoanaerobacterium sp. PSU-2 TaxID=1930849 RepID=UPI000A1521EE|nr:helix-turn-helix domain-containing protein [Thermoanaerobacterium sp. PSU-2]ORX22738.1 hypothetical protein BVF91_09675 [Thermoanaerobacterium sp. PSU-2]